MSKLPPPPPGFDDAPEASAARFANPNLAEPPPPKGFDEVDTRGTLRKAYDAVVGRQDPTYAHLPTMEEVLLDEEKKRGGFFRGPELRQINASAPVAVTDEAYGDVMGKAIGERFIRQEKDRYGYPIIVYRGPDGSEKRAYVNRPGLDSEDVARGIMQAVPYVAAATGIGAAPVVGAVGRGLLQGAGAAFTSVAQDKAAQQLGSEQPVDHSRALVTGLVGGAFEAASGPIAAAWRRFITEPGLYNAATGQLTPKGMTIAVEAGLDPKALKGKLAQEFARTYAKTGDAAMAGNQYATHELGIESTIGQRTKRPDLLFEEEAMRRGLRGDAARETMEEFDRRQRQQVANAIIGNPEAAGAGNIPGQQGIVSSVNPARDVRYMRPQDVGTPIQEGLQAARQSAKGVEREAWRDLRAITAEQQALDEFLPQFIAPVVREGGIDAQLTPNAYRMVDLLRQYQTGHLAQDDVLGHFAQAARPTVEDIRRRLLAFMDNALPGSADKRAAGQLYRSFDDWLGASAEAHLISGHPDAAMAIRNARGISAEIKDLFKPRGNDKAAGSIISRVMDKADSPEAVVNALLGNGPQGKIQTGAVGAMNRIKTILGEHGGAEGQNVWNDIRSAYLMRATHGPNGEMMNPQAMLTSLRKMFEQQESLVRTLYTPQEVQQMRKFMRSLESITYKPPNPSGSAYGVIQGMKDMFSMLLGAIPGAEKVKVPLHIAWKMTGVPSAKEVMAARAAQQATRPGLPASAPPTLGGYGAVAEELNYANKERSN